LFTLSFHRSLKLPTKLRRVLPFSALSPAFCLHAIPLGCGNEGGEAFK
jgi:hypothetical protein